MGFKGNKDTLTPDVSYADLSYNNVNLALSSLNHKFKENKLVNNNLFSFESTYSTPFEDELAIKHPINFIQKYLNSPVIENALKTNQNIKSILNENNL